jgi:predicted  nucleic acid-binding Zn-ribbon protein
MKRCLECQEVFTNDEVKVYSQKPDSGHNKILVVIQELCPQCKANV